jgi:spermidine synthase
MLHAITITLSAFLLFLVEPILAKQILPWFGGAAGVWTTCLVFFQIVLLAGYAYSDWLVRLKSARAQAWIHCALLAASVTALPLAPSQAYKLHDPARPVTAILALLFTTVGLPFLVLSTTGPLIQAWRARASTSSGVYRLYALSNAASLAALLAYPVLIEPLASLRLQALGWSAGYVAFVACAAACALAALRTGPVSTSSSEETTSTARPSSARQALWFVLAALPSVLLLGVTAHITQDVAPIPFLWVMPLALYLGSFVLCFDSARAHRPAVYGSAAAVLAVAMIGAQLMTSPNVAVAIPLHLAGLFATCMFCHGELAARKPAPAHLTRFYLMISVGGAVGGILVGVVAPLVLQAKLELSIALCGAALLLYVLVPGRRRFVGAAALMIACGAFALQIATLRAGARALSRNFYGTLRVRDLVDRQGHARVRLVHGVILHGEQFAEPDLRRRPTSYFGQGSGIELAFQLVRPARIHAGIIGMGAGTLSAYGRDGDVFRYYELDPAVVLFADRHFTFIGDSAATTQVVVGDGRLGLERDPPQGFDLLVVDAFSSDSVPVHLLTKEAVAVYRSQLRAGGILAFHVTNRHLELAPVVAGSAEANGLGAWLIEHEPGPGSSLIRSRWVVATNNEAVAARLASDGRARQVHPKQTRIWTDDYSNLLSTLRLLHRETAPADRVARADAGGR